MRVFAFERKCLRKYTTYREINYGFRILQKLKILTKLFFSRKKPRNFTVFRENSNRDPSQPYSGLIWYTVHPKIKISYAANSSDYALQ
jgi:hypothetical protein